MANIVKLRRSATPNKVPTTSDIELGELAYNSYDGKLYAKKDNGTASIIEIGGGSGSGDVVGPSSATDNAIARFDGTTGKLIQNGTITQDDTGNLSGILSEKYDTVTTPPTIIEALEAWDSGNGTLELGLKGGNVSYKYGQQEFVRAYNGSGSAMTKGQIVYIVGAQGNRVDVRLALADSDTTSAGTIGWVAESIANGAEGWVQVSGTLPKLDTSTLTAGQALYLSPTTAGAYTTTRPTAPNHTVVLGWVERVSSTVGSVYIKIDNGYELDELHNVLITSPTSGNTLIYDAVAGVWENANISAGTGISVTNGAGSITIANTGVTSVGATSPIASSGGATPTISISQATTSTNGYLSSTDWNTFNNKVSMVYPGAGIPVSTGSAWDTSKATPTGVIVGTTDSQTLTNKQLQAYTETCTTVGTVSASTYNIDLSLSNFFDITLGNNVTFTFTNPPASGILRTATIILRQDATGNRTATFTNAKYTDGNLPVLSTGANQIDVLTYFTVNGGSFWFGTFAMANVS